MSARVEDMVQRVMDRLNMPNAVYIQADGVSVITDVPPFPPVGSRVRRRTRVLANPNILHWSRKGFFPPDAAAVLTEVEWPVTGFGFAVRRETRVTNLATSMGQVVEFAALGVVFRVIAHRSFIDD